MKKITIAYIALIAMSIGSVQATTLEYLNEVHDTDRQLHFYEFDNLSTGDVSIWLDTIKDGFDSSATLFVKNGDTGTDQDWTWNTSFLIGDGRIVIDPATDLVTTGKNVFEVDLKNGYVPNDKDQLGISDTGRKFLDLVAGSYLFVVSDEWNVAAAEDNAGGTLADGYTDYAELFGDPTLTWTGNSFYTGEASPFKVFISGDVAEVSQVPVPAAVWLFFSAIAGLGVVKRKQV